MTKYVDDVVIGATSCGIRRWRQRREALPRHCKDYWSRLVDMKEIQRESSYCAQYRNDPHCREWCGDDHILQLGKWSRWERKWNGDALVMATCANRNFKKWINTPHFDQNSEQFLRCFDAPRVLHAIETPSRVGPVAKIHDEKVQSSRTTSRLAFRMFTRSPACIHPRKRRRPFLNISNIRGITVLCLAIGVYRSFT